MTSQPTLAELKAQAKISQSHLDDFDRQISELQKDRAVKAKELRSITTEIVTLEIKGTK